MLIIFLLQSTICFSQKEFNITTFGAKADGKTNNTLTIQKAIDDASNQNGIVIIPKGNFLTGPLELKSNVELRFQKDGVLLGSTNRIDYGDGDAKPLLHAKNANNISITGNGIINGQGQELVKNLFYLLQTGVLQDNLWKTKYPEERNRPKIFFFQQCSNVVVKNITLKNAAGWVQEYRQCRDVIIDSITVQSIAYWNNDGIDITNSKKVSITHCFINAADDAICLKSEGARLDSCVNILIADCKLRSSANAFKIGTGSNGGFRNITVRDLEVFDTYRSAIALEAVDGGFLENVNIKNIKARNTGNAIFIKLGHRNNDERYSTIKNIFIADVYVEVPASKPDKGYPIEGPGLKYPTGIKPIPGIVQSVSPWNNSGHDTAAIPYQHNVFPSSISGLPNHPVEDVRLENIEIIYESGADKNINYFPLDSLHIITEATASYPEFSMFGELPVWGFYLRHVKGFEMKNIKLSVKKDDYRAAMIADDVNGLTISNLSIPSSTPLPVIVLNKTTEYSLEEIKLVADEKKAVRIQ